MRIFELKNIKGLWDSIALLQGNAVFVLSCIRRGLPAAGLESGRFCKNAVQELVFRSGCKSISVLDIIVIKSYVE